MSGGGLFVNIRKTPILKILSFWCNLFLLMKLTIKSKFTFLFLGNAILGLLVLAIIIPTLSGAASGFDNYLDHTEKRRQLLMEIRTNIGYGGEIHFLLLR